MAKASEKTAAEETNSAAEPAAPLLQEETVARGRSVKLDGGEYKTAGEKIMLPAAEATRLRGLGFIVDPNAVTAPIGNGPNFAQNGGPQIRRVA